MMKTVLVRFSRLLGKLCLNVFAFLWHFCEKIKKKLKHFSKRDFIAIQFADNFPFSAKIHFVPFINFINLSTQTTSRTITNLLLLLLLLLLVDSFSQINWCVCGCQSWPGWRGPPLTQYLQIISKCVKWTIKVIMTKVNNSREKWKSMLVKGVPSIDGRFGWGKISGFDSSFLHFLSFLL